MTLRTMLGSAWAILCGMAGGWLVLMPWALHVQGDGDWNVVTKVSFGTGLGLLLFCLVGFVLLAGQIMSLLRPARAKEDTTAKKEEEVHQEDLDRALLQLATKLVADLDAPRSDGGPAAVPQTAPGAAAESAPTVAPAPNGGPAARGETTPTWRRVDQ